MAVKDPIALAARVAVVLGVALVGVGGLMAALDLEALGSSLRTTGVAVAVLGFVGDAVRAGTPTLALASLLPAAGVAFWVRSADNVESDEQTAVLVSLAVPFLAVAARQLLSAAAEQGASWFVGVSGAVLALLGAVTAAAVRGFEPEAIWALGFGGALLVTYAVADRQVVGAIATSRSFVYGAGSWVLVALMGALSVGSWALARRNDHTWDLTRNQLFSLSEQSVGVVGALQDPVNVLAFYGLGNPQRQEVQDLLRKFTELNPQIEVEWIDPLLEPRKAKENLISGETGTLILRRGDKDRRIEGDVTEERVVRELVLLQSTGEHDVCWVQGHGEPDPDDDRDLTGFGGARSELESLNYKVRMIHPAREGIPSDCEAVVVAAPTEEWFPYEREALLAYLAMGGRALVLVDPFTVHDTTAELERAGVRVGEDVVIDLDLKSQLLGVDDPTLLVLEADPRQAHPIVRSLGGAVVMPITRSVRFNADAEGVTGEELLLTSDRAWGETEPDGPDPRPDPGAEAMGPVSVMVAVQITDPAALGVRAPEPAAPGESPPVPSDPATTAPPDAPAAPDEGAVPPAPSLAEGAAPAVPDVSDRAKGVPAGFAPKPGGRLVVVGDADFATTQYLALGNDRDVVLNALAWLVDEDAQIGERPRAAETLEITLTGETLLCLVSLGVVPGCAILVAIGTRIRRRYL